MIQDKIKAKVMQLYMKYGELQIKKKSVEQQLAQVESELSAYNEVMPLLLSPTKEVKDE